MCYNLLSCRYRGIPSKIVMVWVECQCWLEVPELHVLSVVTQHDTILEDQKAQHSEDH